MPIRLLIADDHSVLRAGMTALLNFEPGMEVVGDAGDVESTIALALEKRPDIILMDISMPETGGIEATRRLKHLAPEVRVLILTAHEDKGLMQEAIHSGAMGYVLKRAVKTDLINAIYTVMRGGLYIHPAMSALLFQEKPAPAPVAHAALEPLTYREIDVLKSIARGYTNQQTAEMLNLSVRTVEYHRGNLMGKLNLRTRAELMKYAEEKGWL
jgi:DNA-binding NarL/FixJ family response regulator